MEDTEKTAVMGCGCITCIILVKIAVLVGIVWVAWHFIAKYW